MKKLIKDEMNIKDIMNKVNLNDILYTTEEGKLDTDNELGNVIMLEYNGEDLLNLAEKSGLDHFNNEYVVLSVSKVENSKRYIFLKRIPMV